jgi:hypothetical protein
VPSNAPKVRELLLPDLAPIGRLKDRVP